MINWEELEAKLKRKQDKLRRLKIKIQRIDNDLGNTPHRFDDRDGNICFIYKPRLNYSELSTFSKILWDDIFELYKNAIIHNDVFRLERYENISSEPSKSYNVTRGNMENIMTACLTLNIVPKYLYTKGNISNMTVSLPDGYYIIEQV